MIDIEVQTNFTEDKSTREDLILRLKRAGKECAERGDFESASELYLQEKEIDFGRDFQYK